jgi:hypothetical protein
MFTSKYKSLLPIAVVLVLLVGAAGLINVLIDAEQGVRTGLHRTDAIILFAAFCMLLLLFLVAHMLSRGTVLGRSIPNRVRYLAAIGLLIFLPQSTILSAKLAQVVHSDITLFALYNIIDIAIGRMMFALMKRDRPLLPSPDKEKNAESKENEQGAQSLSRETIRNSLMKKQDSASR